MEKNYRYVADLIEKKGGWRAFSGRPFHKVEAKI